MTVKMQNYKFKKTRTMHFSKILVSVKKQNTRPLKVRVNRPLENENIEDYFRAIQSVDFSFNFA